MVIYDTELKTKENKIWTKDKIKPEQIPLYPHLSCQGWEKGTRKRKWGGQGWC